MHLFDTTPLIYIGLNLLAFALVFFSIMGIPGNPDANNPWTKKLFKVWDIFLLIAWKGFPALFVVTLLAFCFHYDTIGKITACLSLCIGFILFSTVIMYYARQSK
ncbi:MAG: hypothetical protein JWM14_1471 [Chitinophagaceae bacterium]|nr:hypothetical protein [Chitinophagaceae bacterium]